MKYLMQKYRFGHLLIPQCQERFVENAARLFERIDAREIEGFISYPLNHLLYKCETGNFLKSKFRGQKLSQKAEGINEVMKLSTACN